MKTLPVKIQPPMTRLALQIKIRNLQEELENRHKTGAVKMAQTNGQPIATEELQNELFSLIYKLSKFE
jgi:hypothetical protein